jgi:hypothetical protein
LCARAVAHHRHVKKPYSEWSRFEKRLVGGVLALLALVLVVISLAPEQRKKSPVAKTPATPAACLEASEELADVEARGGGLWRARFADSALLVGVHHLGSARQAERAALAARNVYSAAGGSYLVAGPLLGTDPPFGHSSTTLPDNVRAVAACLRRAH